MEVSYNDLVLGRRIGQGACSSVNLAQHRRTGETYAIKLFNVYDRAQASQLYNEILLLTSFSCDALISLKGAFHDSGSIGVILEYMDRGSLEFIMAPAVRMSESVMASIAFQMVWGLGYLHYEKQIHRDIKPGNALMNSAGQVKLSDFGISKELDATTAMSNSAVGSYLYMSLERLLGDKYDASADVWSVGLSIVQLWAKSYPFRRASETPIHLSGELESFDVYQFSMNPIYPTNMRSFIRGALAKIPSERSSCLELIRDCAWFQMHRLSDLESSHQV
jgi:serine/threonine protein kinase